MYNLCVNVFASMSFPPHSPQAIVKPKPLVRRVANINLSAQAYQYLIWAQASPSCAAERCSFMAKAICEAFKTYIWIRKMIIGKVHHLPPFLTISLSYSHTSGISSALPQRNGHVQGLSLSGHYGVHVPASVCSSSHFPCLVDELKGQRSLSVQHLQPKY